MVDLDSVEKSVVALDGSLKSLEETSFKAGIEFKGMLGSVTKAAYSLDGAGKGWTTFSRLVSGSPLWAIQNKFRAYLSILASFEQRSKNNAKASMEMTKQAMENFQATKKLNETLREQNDISERNTKIAKEMAILVEEDKKKGFTLAYTKMKRQERLTKLTEKHLGTSKKERAELAKKKQDFEEELKQLNIYQYVLEATGSAERARISAISTVTEKQKEMNKSLEEQRKILQEQYAFDKNRLALAEKVAGESAKAAGRGRIRQMFARRRGRKAEKSLMEAEQTALVSDAKGKLGQNLVKSFFDPKQFAGLLLPLGFLKKLFFNAEGRRKMTLKILNFTKALQPVVQMAFRFFVFAIIGIIALLAFIKGAYEIFKILEEMGLIAEIKQFIITAFDIIADFFAVVGAFIAGDYKKAIELFKPLLDKTAQFLINGAKLLIEVAWQTLLAGFGLIIEFFSLLWTDVAFRENVIAIGIKVGRVLLAAYLIKSLVMMGLTLLGIYAIPIGIFILLSAFIVSLYKKFKDDIPTFATNLFEKIIAWFGNKFEELKDKIFKVEIVKNIVKGLFDTGRKIGNFTLGKGFTVDGRANGGPVTGNKPYLVGERGAELFVPNTSGMILNADRTRRTTGNTINITINARDTSDAELRRIADKIGNMVNNKINRRTSSRTLG